MIACALSLCSCGTPLEEAMFGKYAPKITPYEKFDTDHLEVAQKAHVQKLNLQIVHYHKLVVQINDYLDSVDGRNRKMSLFSIFGNGTMGATNVASAALTAAAPAANVVWTQSMTATNAAYSNFSREIDTHRVSGIAIRESMKLTAKDLMMAMAKVKIFEAYEAAGTVSFTGLYNANMVALHEMEVALVLKPFTHVITVQPADTTPPDKK